MRIPKIALLITLCCSLLSGCGSDKTKGKIAAIVYAIKEARRAQAAISETKSCPESLSGWEKRENWGELTAMAGADKVRYALFFKCHSNLNFSITINTSLDSWVYVLGKKTGPLEIQYGHFTDPSRLKISAEDDIVAIANKVARW